MVQRTISGTRRFGFYVLPATALTPMRALEAGEATQRWADRQQRGSVTDLPDRSGPTWPWFLGWLIVSAALWVAERRWRQTGVRYSGNPT